MNTALDHANKQRSARDKVSLISAWAASQSNSNQTKWRPEVNCARNTNWRIVEYDTDGTQIAFDNFQNSLSYHEVFALCPHKFYGISRE